MSLIPGLVNQVLQSNGTYSMHDNTSLETISPNNQVGYYTPPFPSPLNENQRDESSNNVGQGPAKMARKFVCQYCARKFLRAEHLRRHEITRIYLLVLNHIVDTGDKPFQCPYCKEAFSRKFVFFSSVFLTRRDILKRHLAKCRAATGPEHVFIEAETSKVPLRRACDRCARLKVRCDFVQPCSRCNRQSMDCTYDRLNGKRENGSNKEQRSDQVDVNGNRNGILTHINQPVQNSSISGLGTTQRTEVYPGFDGSFPLTQAQSVPAVTSHNIGMYNLQRSSPQDPSNTLRLPFQTPIATEIIPPTISRHSTHSRTFEPQI